MAELLTLASGHHQQCHCRIILSIPTPLPLCFLSVIGSIPLFLILMNLLDQLQQFFQEITTTKTLPYSSLPWLATSIIASFCQRFLKGFLPIYCFPNQRCERCILVQKLSNSFIINHKTLLS